MNLVTGLAEHIAAAGVALWDPAGGYADTETRTCLMYRAVPLAPDRIISLGEYGPTADVDQADAVARVQARIRGDRDPRTVDGIADSLFDLLHGATRLYLGGVSVVQVRRISTAQLGPDENGRWERTDNYEFQAMRPTAHRPF